MEKILSLKLVRYSERAKVTAEIRGIRTAELKGRFSRVAPSVRCGTVYKDCGGKTFAITSGGPVMSCFAE